MGAWPQHGGVSRRVLPSRMGPGPARPQQQFWHEQRTSFEQGGRHEPSADAADLCRPCWQESLHDFERSDCCKQALNLLVHGVLHVLQDMCRGVDQTLEQRLQVFRAISHLNDFGNSGDQVEPSFGEEAGNQSSVAQPLLTSCDPLGGGLGDSWQRPKRTVKAVEEPLTDFVTGPQFFRLHAADTESESSVVPGEAEAKEENETCHLGVRGKPVPDLKLGAQQCDLPSNGHVEDVDTCACPELRSGLQAESTKQSCATHHVADFPQLQHLGANACRGREQAEPSGKHVGGDPHQQICPDLQAGGSQDQEYKAGKNIQFGAELSSPQVPCAFDGKDVQSQQGAKIGVGGQFYRPAVQQTQAGGSGAFSQTERLWQQLPRKPADQSCHDLPNGSPPQPEFELGASNYVFECCSQMCRSRL